MRNGEKGFTLIELLIATAVSGLIVSFLGTAVYQILTVSEYSSDRLEALHDVQNAAYWISVDGQGASTATGGSELVLTLPGGSTVSYTLAGTELRRVAAGSQMTVARSISGASFSVQNRTITADLTSSPRGRLNVSERRTYQVHLRPAQ